MEKKMKIKEYIVLQNYDSLELVDEVNDHIKSGFIPIGGVHSNIIYQSNIRPDNFLHNFYQAMVKYED